MNTMQQNYKNHVQIYKPHMFVFGPILLIIFSFSGYKMVSAFKKGEMDFFYIWLIFTLLTLLIVWLSMMLRTHYALTLQNRLILQEVDFRYYRMTGTTLEEAGLQLTDEQVFAVRFASDEEFLDLIQRVHRDKLQPEVIKSEIKKWKADNRRV